MKRSWQRHRVPSVANYHGAPLMRPRRARAELPSPTSVLLKILRLDAKSSLRQRLQDQVPLRNAPLNGLHPEFVEQVVRYGKIEALARRGRWCRVLRDRNCAATSPETERAADVTKPLLNRIIVGREGFSPWPRNGGELGSGGGCRHGQASIWIDALARCRAGVSALRRAPGLAISPQAGDDLVRERPDVEGCVGSRSDFARRATVEAHLPKSRSLKQFGAQHRNAAPF